MGIIPRQKTQLAFARCIARATSRCELDTLEESLREHVALKAEREVLLLLLDEVRRARFSRARIQAATLELEISGAGASLRAMRAAAEGAGFLLGSTPSGAPIVTQASRQLPKAKP